MEISVDHSQLTRWMMTAVEKSASDLHIVVGHPPTARIHGRLFAIDTTPLSAEQAKNLLLELCPKDKSEKFHADKNLDFAPTLTDVIDGIQHFQRFRANYFVNGQEIGACFRIIPSTIPNLAWANFPTELAEKLAHFRNGLVLISGITGSGKSTTLAMIVNMLVEEGGYRIITIEEPIEYVFSDRLNSVVTQREVGQDVHSFADGLKYGLRQDPDVILVGEIRDHETAQMALSAAETGHLVFSTLHTRDAKGAISRFADLFPQSVQADVRSQLALSLRAVVAQHLLPCIDNDEKQQLDLEIMFNNSPIGAAIRTGRLERMDNNILTGKSAGMILLDESIRQLLKANRISRETAERYASDPRFLAR